MPVYLAVPLLPSSDQLNKAVTTYIDPADRYQLQAESGWFIRFPGTTVELSEHIKLVGQADGVPSPVGSALIVSIGGYYGRGPTDMWEWLKTRIEQ